jgi:hypothetical protein
LPAELSLQISCTGTQLISNNYEFFNDPGQLVITSILDGASGSVSIPISSSTQGAVIHIETVISNVSIQRWTR